MYLLFKIPYNNLMRQINANTIIIPILTVEETTLGNLLAQNEMACP